MRKTFYFVIGIAVLAAAIGGFWYRVQGDPSALRRYDWVMEQTGFRKSENTQNSPARAREEIASSRERRDSEMRSFSREDRVAARRERVQQRDQLELFKLGIDLANIVVGLIGIYLAFSGMRMRRESSQNQS